MNQKPLPKRFAEGFYRLNFANRSYIESLAADLLEIDTQSPPNPLANGPYTVSPSHKSEKTTRIPHPDFLK